MTLTLKEIFERYPIRKVRLVNKLGYSASWLSIHINKTYKTQPDTFNANIKMIETNLQILGSELKDIKLSPPLRQGSMTTEEFFATYPFTLSGIARKVDRSREWITGGVNGRLLKKESSVAKVVGLIENYLQEIGKELETIKITG